MEELRRERERKEGRKDDFDRMWNLVEFYAFLLLLNPSIFTVRLTCWFHPSSLHFPSSARVQPIPRFVTINLSSSNIILLHVKNGGEERNIDLTKDFMWNSQTGSLGYGKLASFSSSSLCICSHLSTCERQHPQVTSFALCSQLGARPKNKRYKESWRGKGGRNCVSTVHRITSLFEHLAPICDTLFFFLFSFS